MIAMSASMTLADIAHLDYEFTPPCEVVPAHQDRCEHPADFVIVLRCPNCDRRVFLIVCAPCWQDVRGRRGRHNPCGGALAPRLIDHLVERRCVR